MKEETLTVIFEPIGRRIKVPRGISILEAAKKAGIGIRSECGGVGLCGKCKVIITDRETVSKITETEKKYLSETEIELGYRLACCTKIIGETTVFIPSESRLGPRKIQATGFERKVELNPAVKKFSIVLTKPTLSDIRPDVERLLSTLRLLHDTAGQLDLDYMLFGKLPEILRNSNWNVTVAIWNNRKIIAIEPGNTSDKIFGVAIDIGTSKIVGHLVDLATGSTLCVESLENPQVMYGEDIITRISFASSSNDNLEILQKLVLEGVNKVIDNACSKAGVSKSQIYEIVIVGNTAMHHIFLGIQPRYLALSPFIPAVRREVNVKARELGIDVNQGAIITVLPIIAGFVGADAVADILATGIHCSKKLSLLMDIGTNTEIILGNSEDMISCSCASGPAFEGAQIKYGMKAVEGAIEKVRICSDYEVEYETIGAVKPYGICGSAMIDIVAELFKHGIINRRGRFDSKIDTPRLRKRNKTLEFVIAWKNETAMGKEITITQKDINEILLAKAAIYAGCTILMREKRVKEADIEKLLIAGAFGKYLNPENAKIIGLIPDVAIDKIEFVGNSAVTGAKMTLLSVEARKETEEISRKTRYLELAANPDFKKEFINSIYIPHKNLSRFPSVKKLLEESGSHVQI